MPQTDLYTDVLAAEVDLDEAQRMIVHARKTHIGRLPFVRSYLNRRQLEVDVRRIQVKAAKQYLEDTSK